MKYEHRLRPLFRLLSTASCAMERSADLNAPFDERARPMGRSLGAVHADDALTDLLQDDTWLGY